MSGIVIAYYSRTGRTRYVAERMGRLLSADLEEIQESKERGGAIGWIGAGKDAVTGKPAELITDHSTAGRSVVIVGTPVWAGRPTPAVAAYLRQVPLDGRKVFAFATAHVRKDADKCLDRIAELAPDGLAGRLPLARVNPDKPETATAIETFAAQICEIVGCDCSGPEPKNL